MLGGPGASELADGDVTRYATVSDSQHGSTFWPGDRRSLHPLQGLVFEHLLGRRAPCHIASVAVEIYMSRDDLQADLCAEQPAGRAVGG